MVPDEARARLLLDDGELDGEMLRITDHLTDELFELGGEEATTVCFPISRLIVDPERFLDEALEPMAERGMGVIYTRTTDGEPLRDEPSGEEREELLQRYYHPHHERLTEAVDSALAEHGRCTLIDAHSFPEKPLPCHAGQYGSGISPDFCIGTDRFHTPPELTATLATALRGGGWTVSIDTPFAGTLVPMKHFGQDRRVSSIMVEVNRRLYVDESTGRRGPIFGEVQRELQAALRKVIDASRL